MPYAIADVKITLGKMTDPLSESKEYLRSWKPNGILRWDIEVPAQSARSTARLLEYSFKLEFEKKMEIAVVTADGKGGGALELDALRQKAAQFRKLTDEMMLAQ